MSLVPPNNLEAEQALLGALLLEPDRYSDVSGTVSPLDFYEGKHGTIYAAISDINKQGQTADLVTVASVLRDKKSGIASSEVAELANEVTSARNALHYATIVAEKSGLRRLMELGEKLVAEAANPNNKPQELLDRYGNLSERLGPVGEKEIQLIHFSETLEAARELLVTDGKIIGLRTGWDSVDQLVMGMQGGQLIIVYGDSKHRKSTFVRNLAANVGEAGAPILFIGLEEIGAQNTKRFLGMGINNLPLVYPPSNDLPSPEEIDGLVNKAVNELGVQLVVIDHLHMWPAKGETEAAGITAICQEMKRVAMKYDVPLILVSHISGDKTATGPPSVNRLKGSTSIKQLADKVICVYSPGVDYADGKDDEVEIWMTLSRELPNRKLAKMRILPNARLVEDTSMMSFAPVSTPAKAY